MQKLLVNFFTALVVLVAAVLNVKPLFAQEHAQSQLTNVGYAPFNLTAPKFNCDGFISSLSPLSEIHIAFLYNTFGNDFRCLNRLLADPRMKTLEVNLINEPGHRNNRLESYEFLYSVGSVSQWNEKMRKRDPRLKQKYVEYVKPLQNVLLQNLRPDTTLLINPGLESNLTAQNGRVLIQWTRPLFPDARIVWNPHRASLSTRKFVGADLVEGHGLYPNLKAPCIYNMDGTDVKYSNRPALGEDSGIKNYFHSGRPLFQQIEKYANRCEVAFIWNQEGNGLNYKLPFRDPRKRNHNISDAMYKQIMQDVIALHRKGKVAPIIDTYTTEDNYIVNSCAVVSSNFEDGLKSGRLLKQSEFPDRGGVLILPTQFRNVSRAFLIKGRQIVDEYSNTGPYHDGRPLFRSKLSPTKYPFNTYLYFTAGQNRYCYKLFNPRIRLD
jgi:hypothetical protein